jgi:hypothetical protein
MPAQPCTYRPATTILPIALAVLLTSMPAALGAHAAKGERDATPASPSAQQPAPGALPPLTDTEGDEVTPSSTSLSRVDSHIRITDYRLRTILETAAASSPTLHALVTRLQASDVVAFVDYDMSQHSRLAGHLSFVSSAAGTRYVRIRVAYLGVAAMQAAVVGHELRHAVEVADNSSIVDVNSLERLFGRIGFENRAGGSIGARTFETRAAQDAGDHIMRELRQSTD